MVDIWHELPQLQAELMSSSFNRDSILLPTYPDVVSVTLSYPMLRIMTLGLVDRRTAKIISSIIDHSISEIATMNVHLYQFYHTTGQLMQSLFTSAFNYLNLDVRTFDHLIYPAVGDAMNLMLMPYQLYKNLSIVNSFKCAYKSIIHFLSIAYYLSPRMQYNPTIQDRVYQIFIPLQKILQPVDPKKSFLSQNPEFTYHFLTLIYREFTYQPHVMLFFKTQERKDREEHASATLGNYYATLGRNVDKEADLPRSNVSNRTIYTSRYYTDKNFSFKDFLKSLHTVTRYGVWSLAYYLRSVIPIFDSSDKGDIDQMIMYYIMPTKIMQKKRNDFGNTENQTLIQSHIHYDDSELQKNSISKILKDCEEEIGWSRSFLYIPPIHSIIFQPKYKIGDFYYSLYEMLCVTNAFVEASTGKIILTQPEIQRLCMNNIGQAGNPWSLLFHATECFKRTNIMNVLLEMNNIPTINIQTFIKDALLKNNDYQRVIENMYPKKNWIIKKIQNFLQNQFVEAQTSKSKQMLEQAILHNKISQLIKLRSESQELLNHLLENLIDKINEEELTGIYFKEERNAEYRINSYGLCNALSEYVNVNFPIAIQYHKPGSDNLGTSIINLKLNIETNASKTNLENPLHKAIAIFSDIHSIDEFLTMLSFEFEANTFESQFKYAHTYDRITNRATWRLLDHLNYELEQYVPFALSILMPSSMINTNRVYYSYLLKALKAPYIQNEMLQKTKIPLLSYFDCVSFHSTYIDTFVFFNNLAGYKGYDNWCIKHHSVNRIFSNLFWKAFLTESVHIPINYIKYLVSKLPRCVLEMKGDVFTFEFDIKKIILGRFYQTEAFLKSNMHFGDIMTSKITPMIQEAFGKQDRYPILNMFNLFAYSFSLGSIIQPKGSSFALSTGYILSQQRAVSTRHSLYLLGINFITAPKQTAITLPTRDVDTLNSIDTFLDLKLPYAKKYNEKYYELLKTIKNRATLASITNSITFNYSELFSNFAQSAFTLSAAYQHSINYMFIIPLKSYFKYGDNLFMKIIDFDISSDKIKDLIQPVYDYKGKDKENAILFKFNLRDLFFLCNLQFCLGLYFQSPKTFLAPTNISINYEQYSEAETANLLFEEIFEDIFPTHYLSTVFNLIREVKQGLLQNKSIVHFLFLQSAYSFIHQGGRLIPHMFGINIQNEDYSISKSLFSTRKFVPYFLRKHADISFKGKHIFYKEPQSVDEIYLRISKNLGISINPLQILKIFRRPLQQIKYLESYWTYINYNVDPQGLQRLVLSLVPHICSTTKYLLNNTFNVPYKLKKTLNISTKLIWFASEFFEPFNTNLLELSSQDSSFTFYINSRFGTIALGINPELTQTSTLQFLSIEFFNQASIGEQDIEYISNDKIIGIKSIL